MQAGAGLLDGGAHGGGTMRGEVVQDHLLARSQGGDEDLADISEEGGSVHRPVEHHRRGHAAGAERADEGGGLPVPVRHGRDAAGSTLRSAVAPRHLGGRAGLVDEDELGRIEVRLRLAPGRPLRGDVGPGVLGGVRGFF